MNPLRFYERLGFRILARLPGYFDDEHDLLWLDRALAGGPVAQ